MSTRIKKQVIIIIASLSLSLFVAFFLYEAPESPEVVPVVENQIQSELISAEASQTAIQGVVLANNQVDQLQVRIVLRDSEKEVTVLLTNETTVYSRVFENGQVSDKKTSLNEVSIGDEVGLVVLTNDLNLAEQSTLSPIEVIIRG